MKIFQITVIGVLALSLVACEAQNDTEESLEDLSESLDELSNELDELNPNGWTNHTEDEMFEVELPNRMSEMPELNAEASLSYGYIEQVGDVVKENYLIIITDYKDSIATEEVLGFDIDAKSYSILSVESITAGLETYEMITPDAEIEELNGMDCVINEIQGEMVVKDGSAVSVYYMMSIFEGENAFYQLLSWTIADQKDEFKDDMNKMMMSFKEK
jgi:hypothetical protein